MKNDNLKLKINKIRHSLSHLMAVAILEKFPNAKLSIGPTIENGFYYDFDKIKISDADLLEIEKRMRELIKQDLKFKKKSYPLPRQRNFSKTNRINWNSLKKSKKRKSRLVFIELLKMSKVKCQMLNL